MSDCGRVGKKIRNPLKRRDVRLSFHGFEEKSIPREVEAGDSKTVFVEGIGIERIAVCDGSDPKDGRMGIDLCPVGEGKRMISVRQDDFLAKRVGEIQIPSKVGVLAFDPYCCTHKRFSFSWLSYARKGVISKGLAAS